MKNLQRHGESKKEFIKMLFIKHYTNTIKEPMMLKLFNVHGGNGIFVYWLLLEYLRETQTGTINKVDISTIAHYSLLTDPETAEKVVDTCVTIGLLENENGVISSLVLKQQDEEMEQAREQKRKAGKRGAEARKQKEQNNAPSDKPSDAPSDKPSDTVKQLVKEICEAFNVPEKPYYYKFTEILIKEVTPINPKDGDGAAIIREGLKKYKESGAIKSGMVFTINSFFDPEKFAKLYGGAYDEPFPLSVRRKTATKRGFKKNQKAIENNVTFSDMQY